MSMMRLQNKTSYNGFDLSTKRNYTQKMGQLYPLWWQYCIPGDKVKVDLSAFTRTVPVNTAAFARIRQYFDFYFVPLEFLWNKADSVITQMNANQQHATALVNPFTTTDGSFPHTDLLTIANYVRRASVSTSVGSDSAPNKDFLVLIVVIILLVFLRHLDMVIFIVLPELLLRSPLLPKLIF